MDEILISLLSNMDKEENDFDRQLRESNVITENMTSEEADSWRKEDDYSDLDYDFSNVRALIKHPEIPDVLEE